MFIPAANLQMISGRWKVAGDQNVKLGGWIETDHQGKATPSQGSQPLLLVSCRPPSVPFQENLKAKRLGNLTRNQLTAAIKVTC